MKKSLSILLLGIFLFNSAGYYLVFKVAQIEIKKEIKREIKLGLQSEELSVIRFSNSEIKNIIWVKKNKEFIYLDQMFDIVKSISEDNYITYYCINDKQEKKLFKDLEQQVLKQIENNKNSKNNSTKKNFENITKTCFYEELSLLLFPQCCFNSFCDHNESFTSIDLLISTPPPRI